MKNIHILPTDKPSRLYEGVNKELKFTDHLITNKRIFCQNIYITSDEEIKEGDWVIFNELEIVKCTYSKNGEFLFSEPLTSSSNHHFSYFKKIILTTYQDLIKDGVQAIDDEFLEWFCDNPSCEEVKVDPMLSNNGNAFFRYKIINPDEALEKAATKHATNFGMMSYVFPEKKESFIIGAKWNQERSYSEEKVLELLESFKKDIVNSTELDDDFETLVCDIKTKEWFEQFKKK